MRLAVVGLVMVAKPGALEHQAKVMLEEPLHRGYQLGTLVAAAEQVLLD